MLLVSGAETKSGSELSKEAQHVLIQLMEELPLTQAVRLAAAITGESKNMIYSHALSLKQAGMP